MSNTLKSLPREKWTAIKYERIFNNKDYYVSQFGRVKSIDKTSGKEALITGSKDSRGYLRFSSRTKKGIETKFIHKVVAQAYIRQGKKEKPYVVHKDFDKLNNNYRNLKWVNRLELEKYLTTKWDHLDYVKKQGGSSKLTAAKVAMIKKYLLKGKWTKTKIAEKYGVSVTQIKRIERGENWATVEAKV